ncbi:MAG: dihydroorotate dehydrogenase electron transfer subunit [Firmicutes bacterium]|nr:dihydroorotate dehydrogenase electron transfer subunit [Bacillota bacterium]
MIETEVKLKSKKNIAKGIFCLEFETHGLPDILPGQFVNLTVPERPDLILKRPFGIMDFDKQRNMFKIAFAVVGEGTKSLSEMKTGEKTKATLPLGNGFFINFFNKKVVLVGGGSGIFPLYSLKNYPELELYSFLGFKSKEQSFLTAEFNDISKEVYISSDDGGVGAQGFVTDLLEKKIDEICPDLVLACGPNNMLKALKKIILKRHIITQVSVEERMGCGIGACLVCACKILENNKISNKRACFDGPVFNINEVIL